MSATLSIATDSARVEDALYRKVAWRFMPFLMLCYAIAYLDRVNVGFAKLQMLTDLGFSETVYGLGAGIFFIGYFMFGMPSNLIMHRLGAGLWTACIMITWSVISGLMIFVHTTWQFYGLRLLLGLAESGFYPGIILYFTYWFPRARRAHIVALFMAAIPISGIFGGPLSGWIMQSLSGLHGLSGWQWLFLIEAAPALLVGIAARFYLDRGIHTATWLTADERATLEQNIASDEHAIASPVSVATLFADPRLWLMCGIYFCCIMGQYGITFWLPTLIRAANAKSTLQVGLLSAIPYAVTILVMVGLGRSADRRRERRWHLVLPMVAGALGLLASTIAGERTGLAVASLSLAAAGVLSCAPLFWSLPASFLRGFTAAAGIGVINSVGNLAGFAGPYLVGWLKDLTHSTAAGMLVLAATLIIGALAVLCVPQTLANR